MKDYNELTISDDFMFRKIMEMDLDICRHLLEVILNVQIRKVELVEAQKTLDTTLDARGIRLDVYVEDDANSVYDIEMQTTKSGNLPKRSRYYQAMIDSHLLSRGELYTKLRKSFVIFICTFDPFGQGIPIYHFENTCRSIPGLVLNDESSIIFVNTTAWQKAEQAQLKALLQYIDGGIITDEYTSVLENSVEHIRKSDQWRHEYMTLEMKLQEVREEGREEGKLELIFNLVMNKLLTLSAAAEQMHMSEEELRKLLKNN